MDSCGEYQTTYWLDIEYLYCVTCFEGAQHGASFRRSCGTLYFKQSFEIEVLLEMLQPVIDDIYCNYKDSPILIGGDFNARIGTLSDFDQIAIFNSGLFSKRRTCDIFVNKRGLELNDFMSLNGFIVLNGRSRSDAEGVYTFVGGNGSSVIDLAWIDVAHAEVVYDFIVHSSVIDSDHFPIEVIFKPINQLKSRDRSAGPIPEDRCINRLCWDSNKINDYVNILNGPEFAPPDSDLSSDEQNRILIDSITKVANLSGMIKRTNLNFKSRYKKPWFDKQLIKLQKETKQKAKEWKKSGFSADGRLSLCASKAKYKNLLTKKRVGYEQSIQERFASVRDARSFWSPVEICRRKGGFEFRENPITIEEWEGFYACIYPERVNTDVRYFSKTVPELDGEILIQEVIAALNKSKPGRAPEAWSQSIITLIHKKGLRNDPLNYRGIALCNYILKIFTLILAKRLSEWSEKNSLLPETQNGFRSGRSCVDNVFTLQSALHLRLRMSKTSAIANEFSNPVEVTEGVLQGETLSPILFILFIADFERKLRDAGNEGLNINGCVDLLVSLFADDAVVLANTSVRMSPHWAKRQLSMQSQNLTRLLGR
ncbi:uncharacterized protein LOC122510644 [Leptopilina heterotoma]|uniref:uncharacterized protein LOC122510644 n=1 Tax=Leptopilina heterotoma TaxID=63436 RepID=UPI001CA96314|nr:uncharacterized protein LOC122510644 [Leptopilina heterotoma]